MKKWWRSKTIWLNVVGLLAIIVQEATGGALVLDAGIQMSVLAAINLVLRTVTNEPLGW